MSILQESSDLPAARAGRPSTVLERCYAFGRVLGAGSMGAVFVVGLAACVGEAPMLPEMTGLADGSTTAGASDTGTTALSSTGTAGDSGGPLPECGNGEREQGEECDGDDLGGQSRESLGHVPGVLGCSASCMYDIRGCAPPGMVVVPGGVFEMGSDEQSDEQPIRQVYVDTFYVDQTEVTVSSYGECMTDGVCTAPDTGGSCNWMVAGREGHPVNCVNWYQAEDYCAWAGGATKRLPTEAEWEKAARGTNARTYPWGNTPEPSCSHVVMDDRAVRGDGCGNGSTMEVGRKPLGASPYGAQDMAGNVWEWVSDWYASSYDPTQTDNPTGPANGTLRALRGGPWISYFASYFRAAKRGNYNPAGSYFFVGLRCARTPPGAQ